MSGPEIVAKDVTEPKAKPRWWLILAAAFLGFSLLIAYADLPADTTEVTGDVVQVAIKRVLNRGKLLAPALWGVLAASASNLLSVFRLIALLLRPGELVALCTGLCLFLLLKGMPDSGRCRYILMSHGTLNPRYEATQNAARTISVPAGANLQDTNPHGPAAGDRTVSDYWVEYFASTLGTTIHAPSMSRKDQKLGREGTRNLYWWSDWAMEPRRDDIKEGQAIFMRDVDTHITDLEDQCANLKNNPVIIYTPQPLLAACADERGIGWSWGADGKLSCFGPGTGTYNGLLWNYGKSRGITMRSFRCCWALPATFFSSLGFALLYTNTFTISLAVLAGTVVVITLPFGVWLKLRVVHYSVVKYQQNDLRALVVLVPLVTLEGFWAWAALVLLPKDDRLELVDVIRSGKPDPLGFPTKWVFFCVKTKSDEYFTACRLGNSAACIKVSKKAFEVAASWFRGAGSTATIAGTRAVLTGVDGDGTNDKELAAMAPLLLEFLKHHIETPIVRMFKEEVTAGVYSTDGYAGVDSPSPCMKVWCNPMYPYQMLSPSRDTGTLIHGVLVRIVDIVKRRPTERVQLLALEKYRKDARYFAKMVRGANKLDPVTPEYVIERQPDAGRKAAMQRAAGDMASKEPGASVFLKDEAMKAGAAARVISTFTTQLKLVYAMYMYPFMDHVFNLPFYGGGNPTKIAANVARVTHGQPVVMCIDFSKYDGTITKATREACDREVLNACFDNDQILLMVYEKHFMKRSGINIRGPMGGRLTFDADNSQRSGAMDTSALNTIRNAFICFLVLVKVLGSAALAYEHLTKFCIFNGDDSIVCCDGNFEASAYLSALGEVTRSFGMKTTADVVPSTAPFVYLSRYWMCGDENSMCDPKRFLSKWHLSSQVGVPSERIAREKTLSLLAMDANTPWVGRLGRTMAQALNISSAERCADLPDTPDVSYHARTDAVTRESGRFPNAPCDWYSEAAVAADPDFDEAFFNEWCASVLQAPNQFQAALLAPIMIPALAYPDSGGVLVYDRVFLDGKPPACSPSDLKAADEAERVDGKGAAQNHKPGKGKPKDSTSTTASEDSKKSAKSARRPRNKKEEAVVDEQKSAPAKEHGPHASAGQKTAGPRSGPQRAMANPVARVVQSQRQQPNHVATPPVPKPAAAPAVATVTKPAASRPVPKDCDHDGRQPDEHKHKDEPLDPETFAQVIRAVDTAHAQELSARLAAGPILHTPEDSPREKAGPKPAVQPTRPTRGPLAVAKPVGTPKAKGPSPHEGERSASATASGGEPTPTSPSWQSLNLNDHSPRLHEVAIDMPDSKSDPGEPKPPKAPDPRR